MKMHFLSGGRLRMRKSVYLPDAERSEMMKSLAEVAHIQSGGATVICGHDATQWATLRKGPNGYD